MIYQPNDYYPGFYKEQLEDVKAWLKPKYALIFYWDILNKGPEYPKIRTHDDGSQEGSWETHTHESNDSDFFNEEEHVYEPLEDDLDIFMTVVKMQKDKYKEYIKSKVQDGTIDQFQDYLKNKTEE